MLAKTLKKYPVWTICALALCASPAKASSVTPPAPLVTIDTRVTNSHVDENGAAIKGCAFKIKMEQYDVMGSIDSNSVDSNDLIHLTLKEKPDGAFVNQDLGFDVEGDAGRAVWKIYDLCFRRPQI